MKTVLFIFSVFALSLLSCNQSDNPIYVGVILDLSGMASGAGFACRNGIQLSVDEKNSNGGVNGRLIKLIIEDDKGNPDTAQAAAKRLISKNIPLILGCVTSNSAKNVMTVAKNKDVVVFSPTVASNLFYNIDDNFFTNLASSKSQSELLVQASQKYDNKSYALVYDENNYEYAYELIRIIRNELEHKGEKNIKEYRINSLKSKNYNTISSEIIKSEADCIFLGLSAPDAAIFAQKIKLHNENAKIYCGLWAMNDDFMTNGGKYAEGTVLAGAFDSDSKSMNYLDFKKKYKQAFNCNPLSFSMIGYETAEIALEALSKCKDISYNEIKTNLIATSHFNGLQDQLGLNKYGDSKRPYSLFIVKNGKFIKYFN